MSIRQVEPIWSDPGTYLFAKSIDTIISITHGVEILLKVQSKSDNIRETEFTTLYDSPPPPPPPPMIGQFMCWFFCCCHNIFYSFLLFTANGISDSAWHQAQISLSRGGLGLRSLSKHFCAAFIASFCSSGFAALDNSHLIQAVARFNGLIPPSDATTETSLVASPPSQRSLSIKLGHFDFQLLFDQSSLADEARSLSVSAPHGASWLSVIPSVGLGLHLDPDECRTAVKWWLGTENSYGSNCVLCPDSALDPFWPSCSDLQTWW